MWWITIVSAFYSKISKHFVQVAIAAIVYLLYVPSFSKRLSGGMYLPNLDLRQTRGTFSLGCSKCAQHNLAHPPQDVFCSTQPGQRVQLGIRPDHPCTVLGICVKEGTVYMIEPFSDLNMAFWKPFSS